MLKYNSMPDAWLIAPVLRLNAFLPSDLSTMDAGAQAALRFSWSSLLGIPLVMLVACLLLVAAYVLLQARTRAARALRLGDT